MELGPGEKTFNWLPDVSSVRDLKTSLTRFEVVSFFWRKLHNVFIDVLPSMKFEWLELRQGES